MVLVLDGQWLSGIGSASQLTGQTLPMETRLWSRSIHSLFVKPTRWVELCARLEPGTSLSLLPKGLQSNTYLLEPDRVLTGGNTTEAAYVVVECLSSVYVHGVPRERIITTNLWLFYYSSFLKHDSRSRPAPATARQCPQVDALVYIYST